MSKYMFLIIFLCSSAFATEVKITRFVPLTSDGRLGELCGRARTEPEGPLTVRAIVDYDSSFASTYMISTDQRGDFCSVVATRLGRVLVVADDVQLFGKMYR